jgi:hypothetical protein
MPSFACALRRVCASLPVLVAVSAVPLCPGEARARDANALGPETLKRAREQFDRALALQTAGDWAGALALLKEVAAVRATPQVRFNIALCEENLGRLVAALGDYELAAADARTEKAEKVAVEVSARLEALRQRIPRVVVERGRGADTATVRLDGIPLGDAVIGTPMPADPGPHTVEASAPGFSSFKRTLRLVEGRTETLRLDLEPLPRDEPPPPVRREAPPSSGGRTAGFVVGGIGLASLGAAGVLFYLRSNAIDDLDRVCGPDRQSCPEGSRDRIDEGQLYTTLGNVGLVAGAAGAGLGLVLIFASGDGQPARASLTPTAPSALAGATLTRRF